MNSEDWVLSLARESLSNDFKAIVGLEALQESVDQLTLIKAFSEAAGNVEATPRLAKSISAFAKYLATCNDEHIEFFGGNLLGVNRIRFLDRDRAKWFDDILAVDEDYLRELVHSVPYIDKEWNVGADVFNLSIVWVLYKSMTSPQAHSKEFQQAMVDTLVILQFRFISSLYTSYFLQIFWFFSSVKEKLGTIYHTKKLGGQILKNRTKNCIYHFRVINNSL